MKSIMTRFAVLTLAGVLMLGIGASAQSQPQSSTSTSSQKQSQSSQKQTNSPTAQSPDDILNAPMTPPRSDDAQHKSAAEEFPFPEDQENPHSYSSSKDSQGDLAPPPGDANHPGGDINIAPSDGVTEMKPWNPHEADKDVEVGTFYLHRENCKAAEARFRDALHWQDNHAEATYRLAQVLEKEGKLAQARGYYQAYLRILPSGQFADDSKKALVRLSTENEGNAKKVRAKKPAIFPPS